LLTAEIDLERMIEQALSAPKKGALRDNGVERGLRASSA
jgi:hypothetical protein